MVQNKQLKLINKFFNMIIKDQKGFSLVEAVIALGIVGVVLVIITVFTISTMKKVKKNEMEDVAVQALTEAMDYMKQPGPIYVEQYLTGSPGESTPEDTRCYFYLADGQVPNPSGGGVITTKVLRPDGRSGPNATIDNTYTCAGSVHQIVYPENTEYEVCLQLYITADNNEDSNLTNDRQDEFALHGIVVWRTIGGGVEVRSVNGYRVGKILPNNPPGNGGGLPEWSTSIAPYSPP